MSFCSIELNGCLGQNPRRTISGNGTEFTFFPVAYDSSNRKRPHTCWVSVVGVGRRANWCNDNLKKGTSVFIRGELDVEDVIDKGGSRKRYHKIFLESIRVIGQGEPPPMRGPLWDRRTIAEQDVGMEDMDECELPQDSAMG